MGFLSRIGFYNEQSEAGQVWSRHRQFLWNRNPLASSTRLRVGRRARNVRGPKSLCRLFPLAGRIPSCVTVWGAVVLRTGAIGFECPGRLSPPFRDAGSDSP